MTLAASPLLSVGALCAALQAESVTLTASRDGLTAAPRSGISPAMADAIRAHKSSLLQALDRLGPITPFACQFCQHDFVSMRGRCCSTCASLIGKPLRFAPDSPEELAFLIAYDRRSHPAWDSQGHLGQDSGKRRDGDDSTVSDVSSTQNGPSQNLSSSDDLSQPSQNAVYTNRGTVRGELSHGANRI